MSNEQTTSSASNVNNEYESDDRSEIPASELENPLSHENNATPVNNETSMNNQTLVNNVNQFVGQVNSANNETLSNFLQAKCGTNI